MSEQIKDVIVINDKTIELFKSAPEILTANRSRTENIKRVGNIILNNWKVINVMPDGPEKDALLAEIDIKSAKYIDSAKAGNKLSKDERAAVTQIMDEFKKMYTTAENEVDITKDGTPPFLIQKERNSYITLLTKKKEEAERKLKLETAKKTEAIDIRSAMEKAIITKTNAIIADAKTMISNFVNTTTLENYDDRYQKLETKVIIPEVGEKLHEKIGYPELDIILNYHTKDEVLIIQTQVLRDYDFSKYAETYQIEIGNFKMQKLDEMPSKKKELELAKALADKQEEERLAQIEIQKKKEIERQKELEAAKDKEAQDALVKKQEEEKKKEEEDLLQKQLQQQKELQDLEEQKKKREEEEKQKIENERIASEQQQKQAVDINTAGDKTMHLFTESAEMASTAVTPDSKSVYRIEVTNNVGYAQIFQFWFETEGVNLTGHQIRKKSVEQMITWAQNYAKKTTQKLDSKFIVYHTELKAK